jgi:RND family efflux transporter MFP subunit
MKRNLLKPLVIALVAVAIIGISVGIAIFSPQRAASPAEQTARTAAAPKPAMTVTTVRPLEMPLPIRLMANGNIAAWQEASIGSELNGLRLSDVRVNVGDVVRAGQVLAVFAGETVQAEVAQVRASLMEAEANAADAAANAARARTLEKTGALSAQQINQYLTGEQTARAKVEAAKAMLAAQQLRLKHLQVVAPDSGIISARMATVGAVSNAGTELFRMIRKGRLEWRAEVTSAEVDRIRPGTAALVTAASGTRIKGTVRMIAPTVDPQNRAALVYVDLQPAADKAAPARAGMFAKGEFDLGTTTALTVPQQAVVLRDGFSYVFRLNPDDRVTQVKVHTGRRLADRVEILEGLAPDARVVASGAGFLNDGDLVRVSDNGGAAAPGAVAPDASQPAPVARQ